MTATQLGLYNGALRRCRERKLSTLTENREARRLLDDAWDDSARNYCLEQGQWYFATRTIQMAYDPDQTPSFGYRYAFSKPTDWVRTVALCEDEFFNVPLLRVRDEAGFWRCDLQTVYLSYVSNDAAFGLDYSKWPETFSTYVETYLAVQIAGNLTQGKDIIAELKDDLKRTLRDAKQKAALAESTRFMPPGTWTMARGFGRRQGWNDGGNRGSLIG